MTALDTVLNVTSRGVVSKTLFDVAFCHMAVFSCCDVGTIVIEEAPNLHKQTPAGPSKPPSGAWHSSIRVGKWYFSTWAPGVISWCLLLGAKCFGKLHHQMVPEPILPLKIWCKKPGWYIWHQFVWCWCFPKSSGNCLVLWRFTAHILHQHCLSL